MRPVVEDRRLGKQYFQLRASPDAARGTGLSPSAVVGASAERVPKSRQMPVQTCWPRAGRRRPKALMAAPLTALPRSRALSMEREHDCRLLDAASRRADSRKAGLVMRPISRVIPLIIAGIVGIGAVGIGSWPPLTAEWAHRVVPSPPASPRLLSGRRARLVVRETHGNWAYESIPIDVGEERHVLLRLWPSPSKFRPRFLDVPAKVASIRKGPAPLTPSLRS